MRVPDSVNLVAAFREIRKGVKLHKPQDVPCGIKMMKHPIRVGDMKCESGHL